MLQIPEEYELFITFNFLKIFHLGIIAWNDALMIFKLTKPKALPLLFLMLTISF